MGRKPGEPWIGRDAEHGDVLRYAFTVGGRRYRGSTGERDLEAATRYVDKLRAQILLGRAPVTPPRPQRVRVHGSIALDILAAKWLASLEGRRSAEHIRRMMGQFRAHFIPRWPTVLDMAAPGAIDVWTTERLSSPAIQPGKLYRGAPRGTLDRLPSAVTVHKDQVAARKFLKWAKASGYIDEVPKFERVAPLSHYVAPDYTPDMIRKLLAAIPDRYQHPKRQPAREWFTVQWAQAFRAERELATLTWSDVDLERAEITIRAINSKSKEGRTVALAPEALAVLRDMAKDGGHPLPTALVFGRRNFRESLAIAVRRLEYPKLTRHNLRNARLSELGNAPGTSVAALQYFAGHKHLATTDRYVKSRTRATRDMLDQLATVGIVSRSGQTGTESGKRRRVKSGAGAGT